MPHGAVSGDKIMKYLIHANNGGFTTRDKAWEALLEAYNFVFDGMINQSKDSKVLAIAAQG